MTPTLLDRVLGEFDGNILAPFHSTQICLVIVRERTFISIVFICAGLFSIGAVGVAQASALGYLLRMEVQAKLLLLLIPLCCL